MEANITNQKNQGFVLLLAGIATGAFAQVVLLWSTRNLSVYWDVSNWWANAWNNTSPLPGMLLYMLAGILLLLGMHRLGVVGWLSFKITTDGMPWRKPAWGLWITSLGVAGVIAAHAARLTGSDPYGYFFAAAWLLNISIFVLGVLREQGRQFPSIGTIQAWFKAHRAELFVVATIVIATFLIRSLDVELHPYSFINDEGQMGSGGECVLHGHCTNFFSVGWAAQPQPAFLPYAISIWLFGETAFAVRLVSVLVGAFSVLALYLLAREIFSRKVAWLAALLLSTLPVHVHFSRTGVDNIVDSLTAPLILWLLFRGIKRGSTLSFLAAGIVAGLCIYTYPGSLLAPVLGMGALGLLALRTRGFLQAHSRNIFIFILAGMIVVIPILGYYDTHPDFFLARMKKEGILQNGGLQGQMLTTGKSAAEILVSQFAKSALVFIATGAPLNFFNSPTAYLPPIEAVVFMFGLVYILWRIKDARHTVILAWFCMPIILGSALTGGAPTSQRILMSLPALALIVAIGATKTLEAVERFRRPVIKFMPGVLLVFILYIGYANISFYFYDYRVGHYYESTTNELTYETRIYTMPLNAQGRMFLIGNPKTPYVSFKSFDYFAPDMEKFPLNNITVEKLAALPYNKDALFIALPDYKSDLELVAQLIPGGEWHEIKRRYQSQYTLCYVYRITKERLAVFTGFSGGYEMLIRP